SKKKRELRFFAVSGGWGYVKKRKKKGLSGYLKKKHIARVKKTIPADRLLIYHINEGWGPLCDFLNVDIPESIPFPETNDTAKMLRNFAVINSLPYLFILSIAAILVILFMLVL
ncbi:MAG TPA: sulfotransferase, partial [Candidatus Marinimicrobia bacterium]|nr:sulfotransferase [Candidatus Neomarinimicrobiota bacterium]